ncbi:Uma2 family endonuclease [Deinococcus sp. YIM 134068]|uniref:Uma2 family endonuclease n=1 Tax=Deinococcus lichenicola TaxID=3118910 RepID=UPI002F94DCDB
MQGLAFKRMSVEEYLRTEIESEFRREYVGGFWYGLHGESGEEDGTSAAHCGVTTNVMMKLFDACDRRELWLGSSQFKLHIPERPSFFYPDLAVYRTENVQEWYGTDPLFLLEVIEPRTELVDRCVKYHAYAALPSLQTYLIAEQRERRVYVYQRDGGRWGMTEYAGDGLIPLPCLGAELSLDEMYDGVL